MLDYPTSTTDLETKLKIQIIYGDVKKQQKHFEK